MRIRALIFTISFLFWSIVAGGILMFIAKKYPINNQDKVEKNFRSGETVQASEIYDINDHLTAYIKEIHGCEYVVLNSQNSSAIVHHEACKNRSGHLNK